MMGRQSILTNMRTIKCKKCGNDMPAGSLYCDKCGASLSRRRINEKDEVREYATRQKKSYKTILFLAASVCVLVFVFIGIRNTEEREVVGSPSENLPKINIRVTPAQYNQLSYGMTYDEVVELLGDEGLLLYKKSNNYMWPGEFYDDEVFEDNFYKPTTELVFSDNHKLIEIRERNLIDASEIRANRMKKDVNPVIISDDMIPKLKERMSYSEFVEVLGAEGLLMDSSSDKNGNDSKKYIWKFRMEIAKDSDFDYTLEIEFNNDKATNISQTYTN